MKHAYWGTSFKDDEILDFYKTEYGIYNNMPKLESNEEWSIVIRFKFDNPFGGYSYLLETDTVSVIWYYGDHNRFRFTWSNSDGYVDLSSLNLNSGLNANTGVDNRYNWYKIIVIRNKTNTLINNYLIKIKKLNI